ncbi:hypothetical protein PT974_04132 [Cladobotryum mycophilum]|uniref:Uncharacterized protein n=1 Tax=Cladobotryum mycophilum TaxID=491253 RepID=A0ABR0SVC1_9HYPO
MGQSIFERIQAKLELFRLEQRYTRRRNRRSTFVSNAVYVDGEYIYQTPNSTGSSTDTSSSRIDALHGEKPSPATRANRNGASPAPASPSSDHFPTDTERKPRLNRFSSMPGFGTRDPTRVMQRQSSMIR